LGSQVSKVPRPFPFMNLALQLMLLSAGLLYCWLCPNLTPKKDVWQAGIGRAATVLVHAFGSTAHAAECWLASWLSPPNFVPSKVDWRAGLEALETLPCMDSAIQLLLLSEI
jgi:hypothetical protein